MPSKLFAVLDASDQPLFAFWARSESRVIHHLKCNVVNKKFFLELNKEDLEDEEKDEEVEENDEDVEEEDEDVEEEDEELKELKELKKLEEYNNRDFCWTSFNEMFSVYPVLSFTREGREGTHLQVLENEDNLKFVVGSKGTKIEELN